LTFDWGVVGAVVGGIVVAAIVAWLVLIVVLYRLSRGTVGIKDLITLLPAAIGMLRRLLTDKSAPFAVKAMLVGVLVYLASPVDLVPDVLPVIGYADDALLVVAVLRSAVRRAGLDLVTRHWRGSAAGLQTVLQFAGAVTKGRTVESSR
jgi:uncharacterized membrane protein YkvA (DUF1232 family)